MSNVAHECPGSTAFIWFKSPPRAQTDLKEWQTQTCQPRRLDFCIQGSRYTMLPITESDSTSRTPFIELHNPALVLNSPNKVIVCRQNIGTKDGWQKEKFTLMGHTLHRRSAAYQHMQKYTTCPYQHTMAFICDSTNIRAAISPVQEFIQVLCTYLCSSNSWYFWALWTFNRYASLDKFVILIVEISCTLDPYACNISTCVV